MRAGGLAGTAFWLMAAPSYPDHDGFTVYLSTARGASSTNHTAEVIRRHAAAVAALNWGPAAGPQPDTCAVLNPLLPVSTPAGTVGSDEGSFGPTNGPSSPSQPGRSSGSSSVAHSCCPLM
jgi:hypothetical protein